MSTPLHLTDEDLKTILTGLLTSTRKFVHARIEASVAPLEARIAELEQSGCAGTWASDRPFKKGQMITYDGSAWIAKLDSVNVRPATDREHWQLMVRRGTDGRDLRDGVR